MLERSSEFLQKTVKKSSKDPAKRSCRSSKTRRTDTRCLQQNDKRCLDKSFAETRKRKSSCKKIFARPTKSSKGSCTKTW